MPIVNSTPSSERPTFPCTCRNPDDEFSGSASANAVAFRHRPSPAFATLLPKNPRETEVYKRHLQNETPLPWTHEEAVLQEDERRLARLCLQKRGYEHDNNAIDHLSMLEFSGPGPEGSVADGLRSMVKQAPTVLLHVRPNSASRLLEHFTRMDVQFLDQHIRRRASANTLRSYTSKCSAVPSASEAEDDETKRRAIAETDFDPTVFCPTVSAFRSTAAQARWENDTGTGDIFAGQA